MFHTSYPLGLKGPPYHSEGPMNFKQVFSFFLMEWPVRRHRAKDTFLKSLFQSLKPPATSKDRKTTFDICKIKKWQR